MIIATDEREMHKVNLSSFDLPTQKFSHTGSEVPCPPITLKSFLHFSFRKLGDDQVVSCFDGRLRRRQLFSVPTPQLAAEEDAGVW